jgi:hypothetical protein
MSQLTEIATFRVPSGTVARLKTLAHRLSLTTGNDITWGAILREAVEERLAGKDLTRSQTDLSSTPESRKRDDHLS